MENFYLKEFIEDIEHELEEHKKKPGINREVQQSVKGDEFEAAQLMDKLAGELEAKGKPEEAQKTRVRAEEMVANELNELDGDAR